MNDLIDRRLREEHWLLRDASTLIETFPSGPVPGAHRCKLCEEYVLPRESERHLRQHQRRLDTIRSRSESERARKATERLARWRAENAKGD